MVNIKLLFIILDEDLSKQVKYVLNKFGIKIKLTTNASGTASPSILDYFGLVESEKEIYMAVIPDYLTEKIMTKLTSYFKLNDVGTGIAFTIPISSSNKFISDSFNKNNQDRSETNMEQKDQYQLIMTIVSEGYLEQTMNAAKRAGCSGGTAIKGRELSSSTRKKIIGFNIEPEKDIVLNIVPEATKTKVMEEITKEVGIKTKAKGICFSLPISDVAGLGIHTK